MADKQIGIEINTRATGGEQVREHIQQMEKMNAGWEQFNDLRREGAEKFPDDLKKQNTFIREQITLLNQLESAGARERINRLQGMKEEARTTHEKQQIQREIRLQQTEHFESVATTTEARAARMQWAGDMGFGDVDDNVMGRMAAAGATGGGMGMTQAGVGIATKTLQQKMVGMGLAGKLALGVGGALGIGAILGGAKFLKGGLDEVKDLEEKLVSVKTIMGRITDDSESFRKNFQAVALSTATTTDDLLQYQTAWLRIVGDDPNVNIRTKGILDAAKPFGIPGGAATEFEGRMSLTGYQANLQGDFLRKAIESGMGSGMGRARLPEFLREVEGFTRTVQATAFAINDPDLMTRYAANLGGLGQPFMGEGGGRILSGIHTAMAGGGMGFQAARRILDQERGPGNYSIGEVTALQQQGMNDPRMLQEYIGMYGEIAGTNNMGDLSRREIEMRMSNQAMMLSKVTGINQLGFYNPDEEINSILEKYRAEGIEGFTKGPTGKINFEAELAGFKKDYGVKKTTAEIAKEIAATNAASATRLKDASEIMMDAVNKIAEFSLKGDIDPALMPNDEATDARAETYNSTNKRSFGSSSPTGSVRSRYR